MDQATAIVQSIVRARLIADIGSMGMLEKSTNVKSHTKKSKKTGKVSLVKSHERKVEDGDFSALADELDNADADDKQFKNFEKQFYPLLQNRVRLKRKYYNALETYTNGSEEINSFLRFGDVDTSNWDSPDKREFDMKDPHERKDYANELKDYKNEVEKEKKSFVGMISRLDKVTSSQVLKEPIYVYRGLSQKFLGRIKSGAKFVDKGFVSTSLSKNTASDFGTKVMKILLPKGTSGRFIDTNEFEFVLPRFAKFRIKSAKGKYVEAVYRGSSSKKIKIKEAVVSSRPSYQKFGWDDSDVEFYEDDVMEAQVRVKAYARVRKGRQQFVNTYTRENKEAQNMKILAASSMEEATIRKILERHDPKILKTIPQIGVLGGNNFSKAWGHANGGDAKDAKSIAGFYSEKNGMIVLNRDTVRTFGWRQVLDHEIGHAAYYHSKTTPNWVADVMKDKSFDRFTRYSREGVHEAFAESYMSYMASGGKAKNARFKKAFKVVKEVIDGVHNKNYRKQYMKYIEPSLELEDS